MQVSVEKINSVEYRLNVTVPANVVEESFQKQINSIAKKANIKGFRPGKAPLSYIRERFGEEARRDALSEVIQQSIYQAISEHKLTPIQSPKIEIKKVNKDEPLIFVALIEVFPGIEKVAFELDNIKKWTVEIMEDDVEKAVEQLRKQYANWKVVERPIREKDRAVIDYHVVQNGEPDLKNKMQDLPLEIGSGKMIPGFESGLLGGVAGEERKLTLTYPDDFHDKNKANQTDDFVVTIKQVFEADIPELDEDFVKKLGIQSGNKEELLTQIRQSLEQERNRLIKEKIKEQVFNQLLVLNPIEVPPSLIEREAKNIHDEIYPPHKKHNHHQHTTDELNAFNEIAKKRVILSLLMAEYAKQTDLKLDKERLQKRIEEIASAYENPSEVVVWLSKDEQRQGIEAQIMEDQIIDKLLENIPEVTQNISYDELKNIKFTD